MKHSDSLTAIGTALASVHAELQSITKDKNNPAFAGSKYVTLDTMLETVRPLLAKNGLSIVQGASTPHTDTDGQLTALSVDTMLVHKSGEWIMASVTLPVGTKPVKDSEGHTVGMPTAQTAGATVTYGRRYGLACVLALASDEDDDGNRASERQASGRRTESRRAAPVVPAASARVAGAIDRLPSWPEPYKYPGIPLKEAPLAELMRIIDWQPKDEERYAPLKEAIVLELERRRNEPDNDLATPHAALKGEKNDGLPF